MEKYKTAKGKGIAFMFSMTLLYNLLLLLLIRFTNSYITITLLKVILVSCNLYQLYYILLALTIEYVVDRDMLYIKGIFGLKQIGIPFTAIEGYTITHGKVQGVKLQGVATNDFVLGRSVVDKIGTTRMFATNTKSILYLKTREMNYGISPMDIQAVESAIQEKGIQNIAWENPKPKSPHLHKDKFFMIPFIIVSIIIVILTLNPFILYLQQRLPNTMPLSFDAKFNPIRIGTGKQFAFTQMIYGALNMALLFCMYYAGHFCAKYDRKSSYKYIYVSLSVAVVFLLMQFRILSSF